MPSGSEQGPRSRPSNLRSARDRRRKAASTGRAPSTNRHYAFHDDVDYGNARQYPLDAGDHVLTLANCADNVQLDQLFYSPVVGDVPLGNDTLCNPPHSIELNGVCQPSCGSQGGNQCGTPCNDHHPFYAYDCGASCCYIAP